MNLNQITNNETASTVLKLLKDRKRLSHETDVDRFRTALIRSGYKIVPEEFQELFKNLEQAGMGELIHGRGKNNTRFKWYYNLRSVAEAAIDPKGHHELVPLEKDEPMQEKKQAAFEHSEEPQEENVVSIKKARGRPKGSKNKARRVSKNEETPDVVIVFTTSTNDIIPLRMADVERLMQQVEAVKAKLG